MAINIQEHGFLETFIGAIFIVVCLIVLIVLIITIYMVGTRLIRAWIEAGED